MTGPLQPVSKYQFYTNQCLLTLHQAMHEGRYLGSILHRDSVQDPWKMPRTDCTNRHSWQPIQTGENNQHMDKDSGWEPVFCDQRSLSPMQLLPGPPTKLWSDRGLPNLQDDSPPSRTQRDLDPKPEIIITPSMKFMLLNWDTETAKYDALNNVTTMCARLAAGK